MKPSPGSLVAGFVLSLAASFAVAAQVLAPAGGSPPVITAHRGDRGEDVVFSDAAGRRHALSDYRGKVVVLNYWATWCGPCKVEMPTLARLSVLRSKDVVVLAVAEPGQSWDQLRTFWARGKRPAGPYRLQDAGPLQRLGVIGLPYTVVYDREGREWARLPRGYDWASPAALLIVDGAGQAR